MLCKVPVLMLLLLQVGVTQRREASLVSVELVLERLHLVNIVLHPGPGGAESLAGLTIVFIPAMLARYE